MSRRIWIDDDVWIALKSQSLSVEESPSQILRRIFQKEGWLKDSDGRMLVWVEEEWDDKLSRSIDELGFSTRVQGCLERLGVKTVGDLVQTTKRTLLATRNFGTKSLPEINSRLAEMGLSLGLKLEKKPPAQTSDVNQT